MSRLRANAAQGRAHTDLVDGVLDARKLPKRFPWRFIAAGGAVVGIVALILAVTLRGGGGNNTPAASGTEAQGVDTPTASEVLTGAPSPASRSLGGGQTPDTGGDGSRDTPEGAIAVSSLYNLQFGEPPPFLPPAAELMHVLDRFGAARGEGYVHSGIDLAPATGNGDIHAVAVCDGRVVGGYEMAGFGKFVVVDCGGQWRSVHAQLTSISVKAGDEVTAGQSELGRAAGMLHFELRWNGVPVDPERVMDPAGTPGPKPTPTATPTETAVPATKTPTPRSDGSGGASDTPTAGASTATPTVAPPTSTPTPEPPTATPTRTPTPRPPSPTPTKTPRPVIK